MSFASGTTFVGYTVQRPLSSDEMGDLYLAQHPRLPHWNALKVLSATLTEDREFRDRFMRDTPIANRPVSPPYPSGDDAVRLPGTRRDTSQTDHHTSDLAAACSRCAARHHDRDCEATNAASKVRRSRSRPWPRALPRYLQESRCPGRRATLPPRRPRRRPPGLIRAARPGSAETQRQVSERESL
jgi:serine/threonine protein kinase